MRLHHQSLWRATRVKHCLYLKQNILGGIVSHRHACVGKHSFYLTLAGQDRGVFDRHMHKVKPDHKISRCLLVRSSPVPLI